MKIVKSIFNTTNISVLKLLLAMCIKSYSALIVFTYENDFPQMNVCS